MFIIYVASINSSLTGQNNCHFDRRQFQMVQVQAITWSDADPDNWRIYAALGDDEVKRFHILCSWRWCSWWF